MKEIETLKRCQKEKDRTIQSLKIKVCRSAEENDRLKGEIRALKVDLKVRGQFFTLYQIEVKVKNVFSNFQDLNSIKQTEIDSLNHAINQLEKQRNSLNSTVNKQNTLIRKLRGHTNS